MGSNYPRNKPRRTSHGNFIDVVAILFAVFLFGAVLAGALPRLVFYVYCAMSVMSFILYWVDKHAAVQGTWRIQENTLHLVALFCGWPGACLAQKMIRHKTVKEPFRLIFSACVMVNIVGLIFYSSCATSNAWHYIAGFVSSI